MRRIDLYVGLFLGSPFCCIVLYICCANATDTNFDYCSFVSSLKSGIVKYLILLFFLKIALAIQGLLWLNIIMGLFVLLLWEHVMDI